MTPESPSPRRLRAPRWLEPRVVGGVLLVLLSVAAGAALVSRTDRTYRMLALSRNLDAGALIETQDLTTVDVLLPASARRRYLAADAKVAGLRLNRPMNAGEMLAASAVGVAPERTTVILPFAEGTAPDLRAGQRIEVWLTTQLCRSVVLLADVTTQAVDSGSDSFDSHDGQRVVVGVPPALAERVMQALSVKDAVIRAGILSGSPAVDANSDLASLASCLPADSSS